MFAHISIEVVVLLIALAVWAVSIMSQRPFIAALAFFVVLGLVLYLVDFPAIREVARHTSAMIGGLL